MTIQPGDRPGKSVMKGAGVSHSRPFSSFDDLAKWAAGKGHAASASEIRAEKKSLWGDLLFEWYTQGQIACVFAMKLAREPDVAKWYSLLVEGPWTADDITSMVDGAAEFGLEGVQLLFPGDGTLEQGIQITKTLGAHPRWRCVDIDWMPDEEGDSLLVGLRWESSARDYESWALGIGDFEPMPFTRRFRGAPFIAIVLRPTQPMPDRAKVPTGETGLPASHLAHMDDTLGADQEKRQKWMTGTSKIKRALIDPDPLSRARARITFAFPASARQELESVLTASTGTNNSDSK